MQTLPTQLLLVRHGETVWNAEGRLQGSNDIELNAAGLVQAEYVAAAIAAWPRRVEAIYSSALVRAYRTGEIIGQRVGLGVTADVRFTERGLGLLEGHTKEELLASDPALWEAWASGGALPEDRGIESEAAVVSRAAAGLADVAARHPGAAVVLCAHGALIKCLLGQSVGNGSITTLVPADDRSAMPLGWTVQRAGDDSHLPTPGLKVSGM